MYFISYRGGTIMPSIESVKEDIKSLDIFAQEQILEFIEEIIVLGSFASVLATEIKENRFSRGKVCPFCNRNEVSRNGKSNGTQIYICKCCKKTFTDFTRSPMHNSKKDSKKWISYAKCMVNGYSIRKSAEVVGISVPTSFYWRHKILDAVRSYMGIGSVGGIVEADEIFFRLSFKGNHKKSRNFSMPRKPHKRGVKGSKPNKGEKRKRGISSQQVCVLCATDRIGNIMVEPVCKGRLKHTDLERFFNERIDNDSVLCTDSHKSYIKFARNFNLELQQIKRGRHKEGIYHIQHINAYHSKLKKWMGRFNGVATKYLANYMYWFKWLQVFSAEKDMARIKHLIVQSHTVHTDTKIKYFSYREPIFV